MFDENDKVNAYVKQKNIGMKIDYNDKARRVLKTNAPQGKSPADDAQAEELDGATEALERRRAHGRRDALLEALRHRTLHQGAHGTGRA